MLGALVSQAIARRMAHDSLYEALLTQDGHQMDHVVPPRDLHGWQQLPVSAIANFQPVVITDLAAGAVQTLLSHGHPCQRFPAVVDGKLTGMLTRKEAEAALRENCAPKLERAVTCAPTQTIRELQGLLIESAATLLVVVVSRPGREGAGAAHAARFVAGGVWPMADNAGN